MIAEVWKNKMKVVFVKASREDASGAVLGAARSVEVFPESILY